MSKIMVVDDERDVVEVMKRILEKKGHEVIGLTSGEKCLEILRIEKPDLILLDIIMPGLDGYDVCRAIREDDETSSIKIAVLTVKSDDKDKVKSLEECADWHISKPIDANKLLEIVDWLLKMPPRFRGYK
jgi:two-component system alkaline phosphatase synthesis response regulator PhoP